MYKRQASDIPALLKYTRRYSVLEEGDMAVVKADGIRFYDAFGKPVEREEMCIRDRSIKRLLPPAPRAPREGRGPRPNSNGPRDGGFRRNGPGGRPQGGRGPARDAAPRVWQPKAPAKSDNLRCV